MNDTWKGIHSLTLTLVLLVIAVWGFVGPVDKPQLAWLEVILLLVVFTAVLGKAITGTWRGAFINEQHRMSLSQLQLVLWTMLVLSAYLTVVTINLRGGSSDPLLIKIPESLWILMGISTTSLVASPLLKDNKRKIRPNEIQRERTFNLLGNQGFKRIELASQGLLVTNMEPKQATWADLFKGDETGNAGLLDIAKLQMFFFTLILVVTYAMAIRAAIAAGTVTELGLPSIPESMLALLGISHAGFLTSKMVPHSETS